MEGTARQEVTNMTGHPNLPRFKAQIRRAAQHAEHHPYWSGSLATYRIVAIDLGYTHQDITQWLQDDE